MKWESDGYAVIRAWQRGRCGMCGVGGALVMDHDHSTGYIRGLLCPGCNTAEGVGSSDVWGEWRTTANPASILGVVEEYRYRIPGQKTIEEQARQGITDEQLYDIADAMCSDEGEWAVIELNRRADEISQAMI